MSDREFDNINGIKVCDQTARNSIPTKTSQLENDSDYATITQVNQAIDNAQLGGGGEVDLSSYAKITDLPTKTSQLTNDSGYITNIPDEYITETELNAKGYATTSQIPTVPTNVSEFTNDANYASETYVTNKIAEAQLGGGSGEVDLSGYVTKETGNASQITFADGQTFQAKLDAGTLKGEKGDQGERGLQGEKGDKGADGLTTSISLNGVTYTQENGVITLPNITSGGNIPSVTQVEPEALDMPKVFFYGNALPTTKDNVNLTMDYISNTTKFSSFVKLKCQGTSSMSYAKKNFTVAMFSDEARATKLKKDFKGWGAQSKFCLKANYVDTTHTRNISGARIAYDMVQSRPDSPFKQQLLQCPRNGAVDGFPIKVYFNGEFYGIYTWNIPKDGWMFNMDKSNPNHVVLCAERNTDGNSSLINSCQFRKLWTDGDGGDWSVEFGTYSTDMVASFNRCINFVMTATDQEFHDNIGEYFDLYSLLDYYCFSYLTAHIDGLAKNMLMVTYDGVIWGATLYDMDSIYGADWQGTQFKATNIQCPEQYQEQFSRLWVRIEQCFATELYARYLELRQGALSLSNIIKHVEEIYDVIPDRVLADEKAKWTGLPAVNTNTMTRFRNYMRDRAVYVDAQMQEIGTNIPCTGIVLSADTLSFTTSDTQTLEPVVSPSNTTDAVAWSVSPTGIVTVNNGIVTPVSNGTCTITATCGSYSDTCAVTVALPVVECTGISLDKTELALGELAGGSGNTDEPDDSQVDYLEGAVWRDGQYRTTGFNASGTNKVASVTVPYVGVYKFARTTSVNIQYMGLGKIDNTGKITGLFQENTSASEVYLTVTEPNTILGVSFYPNGNEITDDVYNSLSLTRVMTIKDVQKDIQFDINNVGKPGWSATTDCNTIEMNVSAAINHKHIFAIKVADEIFEYPLNYAILKSGSSVYKDKEVIELSQINDFAYNDNYIAIGLPTDIFGTTLDSFKEYMTTNSKTIVINPSEYLNQLNTGATKSQELLTATVTPTNCTQPVVWSVSPEGIVTVNNGLVTAIANGEATVTATCGTQSATCAVTVSGMN